MKLVQERGEKGDVAQSMLTRQLYLPSATLKELGGWLRSGDSFLSTRASNIFGEQLNSPKEIIGVALDLLTNDPTSSKSEDIMKSCRTLHREAIAKLLDLFRKTALENMAVASISMGSILQKHITVAPILQRQTLQPDDVEVLETALQQSIPNKGQFVYLLAMTLMIIFKNLKIPENIIKLLVELLKPTHIEQNLFMVAQVVFQRQSHLSAEFI